MHRDQYELEYGRTVHLHLDALLVSFHIIISTMLSPGHILIHLFMLCRIESSFTVWIRLLGSE